MQKLYHVFISSTFADLSDERKKVSEAVAKAGFVPEGMEFFPASSQKQLDFIKTSIDRCDYYVVVVGGRYGTLAGDDVSFTEREYEYATSKGIPVLAFLHAHPDQIPVAKVDTNPDQAERLTEFRRRLSSSRVVSFWSSADELATLVVVALAQESNLAPGVGWVRGDQAADPKVFEELERTRRELAELRQQSARNDEGDVVFPSDLESIDASVELEVAIADRERRSPGATTNLSEHVEMTWATIFVAVSDLIYQGATEGRIMSGLANVLAPGFPAPSDDIVRTVAIATPSRVLRYQFEALGLIVAQDEVARDAGTFEVAGLTMSRDKVKTVVWRLTEKGRRFLSQRMARKRALTAEDGGLPT